MDVLQHIGFALRENEILYKVLDGSAKHFQVWTFVCFVCCWFSMKYRYTLQPFVVGNIHTIRLLQFSKCFSPSSSLSLNFYFWHSYSQASFHLAAFSATGQKAHVFDEIIVRRAFCVCVGNPPAKTHKVMKLGVFIFSSKYIRLTISIITI